MFGISGKTLTDLGKVAIADDKSGVSHVAIAPDGKTALVTRDGDNTLTLLTITDNKVELAKRDIKVEQTWV